MYSSVYGAQRPQKIANQSYLLRINESSVMVQCGALDELANEVKPNTLSTANTMVKRWANMIEHNRPSWLIDYVASFTSLLIEYDPLAISYYDVSQFLKKQQLPELAATERRTLIIPVCYEAINATYELDTHKVVQAKGITAQDIVQLHTQQSYQVYAIGFMPNFAYLGEVDSALHVPRLANPRAKVLAGAVAIADNQTAIYPANSPGGWHIIGYTPINMLSNADVQFLSTDVVEFEAISAQQFLSYGEI
ncbi:MAG: allophanate hydrolase subunit 1 [Glaciecola sp.]